MQQPYRPVPKVGPSKEELEAERLAVDALRRHQAAEGFAERVGRACTVIVIALGAIYVFSAFASHNTRGGVLRLFGVLALASTAQGATVFKRRASQTPYLGPFDPTPKDYRAAFRDDGAAPSEAPVEAPAEPSDPTRPPEITRWTD